jgi:hypothetical protein
MNVSRRRFVILAVALVAVNAFLWLAQGGFALPQALIDRFFGPRMIRAEVVVQGARGAIRDYRLDRGAITSVDPGSITLRERDGTLVTIEVAPGARVVGLGRATGVAQLRPRMRVLVIRQVNRSANVIQVESGGP